MKRIEMICQLNDLYQEAKNALVGQKTWEAEDWEKLIKVTEDMMGVVEAEKERELETRILKDMADSHELIWDEHCNIEGKDAHNMISSHIEDVIVIKMNVGLGKTKSGDALRAVYQYWTKEGEFIGSFDTSK